MSKVTREELLEMMMTRLQHDLESRGGDRDQQRRRQIMRGVRAATYCLSSRPKMSLEEVEAMLRKELFLETVPRRHIN